jgi:NTE family protein
LVLMGGGARTAYQAGALRAIAAMLSVQKPAAGAAQQAFPFKVLVGTSAGALNATFLACRAQQGLQALGSLAPFWQNLRSEQVYRISELGWIRHSRWLTAWALARHARKDGALLDSMPLVDTLHKAITFPAIDGALDAGSLSALAVTASSYSSGVHWTFCQTAKAQTKPWSRPGRRVSFEPISIDHLLASAAIPFIFPGVPLFVDGHRQFFGDGSMRQMSPLSAPMHLGATDVLVIGVGQPERAGLVAHDAQAVTKPTLGMIAGHAMASVFHDTLKADVEQARRVTETLSQLPPEVAGVLPYRAVNVLQIAPSRSLDELALAHLHELPRSARRVLDALGAGSGAGSALASYLLFAPGYAQALMALGEQDAYAQKAELLSFFAAQGNGMDLVL